MDLSDDDPLFFIEKKSIQNFIKKLKNWKIFDLIWWYTYIAQTVVRVTNTDELNALFVNKNERPTKKFQQLTNYCVIVSTFGVIGDVQPIAIRVKLGELDGWMPVAYDVWKSHDINGVFDMISLSGVDH